MPLVGRILAVMGGEKNQEVTDEIGKRMQSVGDQALRMRNDAGGHLRGGQEDIDHHADPGTPLGHAVTRRVVERDGGDILVSAHGRSSLSAGGKYSIVAAAALGSAGAGSSPIASRWHDI
jgi:hypothetical protein